MTDLRIVLASNLKIYRKDLGLSQAKLAEMADVTDNYIALIETGKRFPSLNMIEKIAKVLKRDPLELFSIKSIRQSNNETLKRVILMDIEKILSKRINEAEN